MNNTCKYGEIAKENNVEYLMCTLVDNFCPYIRFCSNDMCLKMLPAFMDCRQKKIKEGLK